MIKRLLPVWLILIAAFSGSAQTQTTIELISQSGNTAIVKVIPSAPVFKAVQTPDGIQYKVLLDEGTEILRKGTANLEKLTTSLLCPYGKKWEVSNVAATDYTDYTKSIVPSKGTVSRNVDINALPFEKGDSYNQNQFFPNQFAFLREPYVLRDYAGQALIIQPTRYNAVTKTVRHYNELIITLKAVNDASGVTSLPKKEGAVPREFNKIYSNHFLNYNVANLARYTPLDEEGEMLIICFDDFQDVMLPFVLWKNQKGIKTVMVPKSDVGTTAAEVKTYITDYYNTHNLAYVMLVGDAAQIPTSSLSGEDSDSDYGYMTGSDSYPEIFVGRFSGTNDSEIQVQVEKSIQYEKNPSTGSAAQWYKHGVGIASDEGPGDDDEMDYQHEQNIRAQLLAYNYDEVAELYEGTQGGEDEAGDPNAQDLIDVINDGVSVMNYTGHGDVTLIVTTYFQNSDVASLTNVDKWPFIWIVGCQTGNFEGNTCFAEKFARATTASGHTGAVVSFMSTMNQYWDEPMEAQDEFNAILTEAYSDNIKRTFGGISMNGCMKMNDSYGGSGYIMTDTWVCFGDPSLMIRTDVPVGMNVTHASTLTIGETSMPVNCDVNDALACLSHDGEIIATATVNGGIATFTFSALTTPDTLLVTVTAYNKVPYQGNVVVTPANGAYVTIGDLIVSDLSGNNNGNGDYNEDVDLTIPLNNIGNADAIDVNATISTTDPYITITNATVSYGTISSGTINNGITAYQIHVASIIPDLHEALLQLTVTDNAGNTWNGNIEIVLHSPILSVESYNINDANGNNNGKLDPGENAIINLVVKNDGTSPTTIGTGNFSGTNWQTTIPISSQSGATINPNATLTQSFNIEVDADAILYSFDTLSYDYDASGYTATNSFTVKIGQANEDFETNDFSKFTWQLSGTENWFTTATNPYEGDHCAQSGAIGNQDETVLTIEINSVLADSIRFARKVSSEDTYDFLKFYIDNVEKGAWSGNALWSRVAYPTTAGAHSYKWTYEKDYTATGGADAAWVDAIDLPYNALATAIIENENNANDVSLYPNPAQTQTTLWYSIGQNADVSIDVFNMLGQKMTQLQFLSKQDAGSYTIDIKTSDWASGQYVIMFHINGDTYTRKLNVTK